MATTRPLFSRGVRDGLSYLAQSPDMMTWTPEERLAVAKARAWVFGIVQWWERSGKDRRRFTKPDRRDRSGRRK